MFTNQLVLVFLSGAQCLNFLNKASFLKDNLFSEEKPVDTLEAAGNEIDKFNLDDVKKVSKISEFLTKKKQSQGVNANDFLGLQDIILPQGCAVEWETCSTESPCCEPLYCSYLPSVPTFDHLQFNATNIDIIQMCSTINTTTLGDLQGNQSADYRGLLDSYRNKMEAIMNL